MRCSSAPKLNSLELYLAVEFARYGLPGHGILFVMLPLMKYAMAVIKLLTHLCSMDGAQLKERKRWGKM